MKRKAPSIVVSYFVDAEPQFIKMSATQYKGNLSMNKLHEKIHQAKKELGLNNTELSLRMGKSKPYIAKMLNQPQSDKVQQAVINKLDDMMEKCEDPCEDKFIANLADEEAAKNKEISDLKKHLEQKTILVGRLSDQLEAAEKLHNKDLKTIKFQESRYLKLQEEKESIDLDLKLSRIQINGSKNNIESLKKKIIRERWIIIIVIAILTVLFFLKGAIGG